MAGQRIGEWDFDAASGELRRGAARRRLEPRAAQTLQMLIEADGAVVPHDRIIAEVWGGRSLSENSVSVVISQLRRLLGDDARNPLIIETVPKRGYRLVKADPGPGLRATGQRGSGLAAALLMMVAVIGLGAWSVLGNASGKPVVLVEDVVNATGNRAFEPHAKATSELLVTQLNKRGFDVRRTPGEGGLRLASKLVMWDGAPYLGMTVTDEQGVVRWSAMTKGGPAEVPRTVAAELERFERSFSSIPRSG